MSERAQRCPCCLFSLHWGLLILIFLLMLLDLKQLGNLCSVYWQKQFVLHVSLQSLVNRAAAGFFFFLGNIPAIKYVLVAHLSLYAIIKF